jgi:predicted  nucleic acid-binding Zn-ribbon protein
LKKDIFDNKIIKLEREIEKTGKKSAKYAASVAESASVVKIRCEENNRQIAEMRDEIDTKLTREEGSRLWGNFSRFAVYDDLKELYQRCLPPISNFEETLKDYSDEIAKIKIMVRSFDETLSAKSNKN